MPLSTTSVEKLNEGTFVVHMSDGSFVVLSAQDMASRILAKKDKRPTPEKLEPV
jgi:hypothetical protein